MPNIRREAACVLAVVAGVLLLLSGIHGPTGTYELISEQLPNYIQDPQVIQVVNILMLILIAISLAGGFAVIAGGILILLNRVGTGKFIISLGVGVGLLWLILLVITLVTTQQVAYVIAEYSSIGWAGIILAFAARIVAK
ncbi:MAG: hypothetical protein NWE99_04035 [Candidatus Bathyarchaeota archaeon]|nr:hypothetical protein [Candidatus Bathyarchaeota archaeon]